MPSWAQTISTDEDSTTSLNNLSQHFTTIPGKSSFSMFKQNFLHTNCLLPLALSLDMTKKSLILSYLLYQVFVHTHKIALRFLFSRLNHPSSPILSLYVRCSKSLGILVALHCPHSSMFVSCRVETKTGLITPEIASPVLSTAE